MKKLKLRMRGRLYPIIWSIIILVSISLLIRFITLSFFDESGQAKRTIKNAIGTNLCVKMIGSSSSLISYSVNGQGDRYSFPINLVNEEFVLHEFIKESSPKTALAKEASSLMRQNTTSQDKEKDIHQNNKVIETIGFHNITNSILTKEYILTNGAFFTATDDPNQTKDTMNELQIGYMEGEVYYEKDDDTNKANEDTVKTMKTNNGTQFTLDQLKDINFLVRNFYIVDGATKVTEQLFDADILLNKDMSLEQNKEKPQILIYHTHSQEAYADSRSGKEEDTVVGVGAYLTKILKEVYGYNVIHDKTTYDMVGGSLDRNLAYNYARPSIEKILEDNPTIEVVIDLHRDDGAKRVTMVNGKETAQIMLFNGLCRDVNGPLTNLDNPNLQNNLAFGLQLQLKSLEMHPGLFFKNYLHCWRYNMHVRPRTLLVELGTVNNSLQSAKNAMEPFAEILDNILKGE